MGRDDVEAWVEAWVAAYEEVWRTPGASRVAELFTEDGRCVAFEEWPFAPDQPDGH